MGAHPTQQVLALALIAAFVAGSGLSVQASLNGALAGPLGSQLAAVCISYVGGNIFLALLAPFSFGMKKPLKLEKRVPWWYYITPPLVGMYFLSAGTFLGPIIGYSVFFVCLVCGQLIVGLTVDHFGFFDVAKQPATPIKIFAVVLVLAGAVLSSIERASIDEGVGYFILYMCLALFGGCLLSVSLPVSTSFTARVGTFPHRSAFLFFFLGGLGIFIVFGFSTLFEPFEPDFSGVEPWMVFGGPCGASFVALSFGLGPLLGMAMFSIASVSGQLVVSLVIDSLGLFESEKVLLTRLRVIGVALSIVGAIVFSIYRAPSRPTTTNGSPDSKNGTNESQQENNIDAKLTSDSGASKAEAVREYKDQDSESTGETVQAESSVSHNSARAATVV